MKPRFLVSTLAAACAFVSAHAAQTDTNLFAALIAGPNPTTAAVELATRGTSAAPYVIRAVQRNDRAGAMMAWALSQHPVPTAAPALRTRLGKVEQVGAYYAARALGKLPSLTNAAALSALLAAETNGYWELSAGGVGRLRDAWDEKGRRFSEPAPTNMPNLRVAYAGMESLGEMAAACSTNTGIPDAAAIQKLACSTLLRALESDQYLIRYGAVRGLGLIHDSQCRGRLETIAKFDAVFLVRRAAAQALATPATSLLALSPAADANGASSKTPSFPRAIAFIKTRHRSDATFGFRDSYFFPKTPRFSSGENIYSVALSASGDVVSSERNLTHLTNGEVQGLEVSFDGTRLLFAMRRNKDRDGFHIFEMNSDGSSLRQLTDGNCNDADPCYLPDGRIAFDSDRCGWQEYYHQERSRVLYIMNADGSGLRQITCNPNEDFEPLALRDGRILYSSYRFYAQDGSEGPLPGEYMGLARIETVLRSCNPDGSADNLFYGAMRGSFYSPMRPMPFSDQWAGWHGRGFHIGVSISLHREMPDGRIMCASPSGLTVVDSARAPLDCELPVFPEVVNLAGGEEVYIHNYDEMNPVGRFTAPYPIGGDWILVSHAPWHDLRVNGYGIYALNIATRELRLIYDDPNMSEVDAVPIMPQAAPLVRDSAANPSARTGRILCNSVFNTDQPFDTNAVRYVRVLEGVQMGQSIAANASFRTRDLGMAPLHPDGSFYVEVPADVPIRFQLLDEDGRMLIHETEFLSVRPGEVKGCVGCHENRKGAVHGARPLALKDPPFQAQRHRGDLIYFGRRERSYNHLYRD